MDKVKIKRVKREHKKATTKQKIIAGLGVASGLAGGVGGVAQTSKPVIVSTQTNENNNKVKASVENIFGVPTAQAREADENFVAPDNLNEDEPIQDQTIIDETVPEMSPELSPEAASPEGPGPEYLTPNITLSEPEGTYTQQTPLTVNLNPVNVNRVTATVTESEPEGTYIEQPPIIVNLEPQAPIITASSFSAKQGEAVSITINGSNLKDSHISFDTTDLVVSNEVVTDTKITATVTVNANAPTTSWILTVRNSQGEAKGSLTVTKDAKINSISLSGVPGESGRFRAYIDGGKFDTNTVFDVQFTDPSGKTDIADSWQTGQAGTHSLAGAAFGRWVITGVRVHGQSGFTAVNGTFDNVDYNAADVAAAAISATGLTLNQNALAGGNGGFVATIFGRNITSSTVFDIQFTDPGGKTDIADSWQTGPVGVHQIGNATPGNWVITGVRVHGQSAFTQVNNATFTVPTPGGIPGGSAVTERVGPGNIRGAVAQGVSAQVVSLPAGIYVQTDFIGANLVSTTYFDILLQKDSGPVQEMQNWQTGMTDRHNTASMASGNWTIVGIRAHSDAGDHSGGYFTTSVGFRLGSEAALGSQALTVSGVTAFSAKQGETVNITITGRNLTGAQLVSPTTDLEISNVQVTASQITATVKVNANAPTTSWRLQIANSAGSAFVNFNVTAGATALSNAEFLTKLYRGVQGREKDDTGYNYWFERLNSGMGRDAVLSEFINSSELQGYLADKSITPEKFAANMYQAFRGSPPSAGQTASLANRLKTEAYFDVAKLIMSNQAIAAQAQAQATLSISSFMAQRDIPMTAVLKLGGDLEVELGPILNSDNLVGNPTPVIDRQRGQAIFQLYYIPDDKIATFKTNLSQGLANVPFQEQEQEQARLLPQLLAEFGQNVGQVSLGIDSNSDFTGQSFLNLRAPNSPSLQAQFDIDLENSKATINIDSGQNNLLITLDGTIVEVRKNNQVQYLLTAISQGDGVLALKYAPNGDLLGTSSTDFLSFFKNTDAYQGPDGANEDPFEEPNALEIMKYGSQEQRDEILNTMDVEEAANQFGQSKKISNVNGFDIYQFGNNDPLYGVFNSDGKLLTLSPQAVLYVAPENKEGTRDLVLGDGTIKTVNPANGTFIETSPVQSTATRTLVPTISSPISTMPVSTITSMSNGRGFVMGMSDKSQTVVLIKDGVLTVTPISSSGGSFSGQQAPLPASLAQGRTMINPDQYVALHASPLGDPSNPTGWISWNGDDANNLTLWDTQGNIAGSLNKSTDGKFGFIDFDNVSGGGGGTITDNTGDGGHGGGVVTPPLMPNFPTGGGNAGRAQGGGGGGGGGGSTVTFVDPVTGQVVTINTDPSLSH